MIVLVPVSAQYDIEVSSEFFAVRVSAQYGFEASVLMSAMALQVVSMALKGDLDCFRCRCPRSVALQVVAYLKVLVSCGTLGASRTTALGVLLRCVSPRVQTKREHSNCFMGVSRVSRYPRVIGLFQVLLGLPKLPLLCC